MTEAAFPPGYAGPWPVLNMNERRVLGVLVEKQKTLGSDAYPMSLNALVTGCNQKSNRDPILDLEEDDVEEALMRCKSRGFAAKVIGGRVERWRHLLYEAWHVDKFEMAVLGELLLRGPQTEGELRTRASRMDEIEDLDTLKKILRPLVERKLVVYLTAEDRRGAMLTHGFHDPAELERQKSRAHAAVASMSAPPPAAHVATPPVSAPRQDERYTTLESSLGKMREELDSSRQKIVALEQVVGELRKSLEQTRQDMLALKAALGG
ncbi:MAG: DUF480 domain-containing protein [Gemmataceae bacterium]